MIDYAFCAGWLCLQLEEGSWQIMIPFPLEMKAQEYINLPNDGNCTGFDRFVPALAS